jgi:hypothetical protein
VTAASAAAVRSTADMDTTDIQNSSPTVSATYLWK